MNFRYIMSRYWSPVVHALNPYVPGEQPSINNLVKLNTNESPHPPSPKALAAMRSAVNDDLRLYPDPHGGSLKRTLAKHFSLAEDQIFLGNSSDEVLALAFQALLKQEKPLLMPDISYGFYPAYCKLYEIDYKLVPLDENFEINVSDYDAGGAIIIANPNAPTGCALDLDAIESLLARHRDKVVVIDEAYVDFGTDSAVSLIGRFDNLLVIQTLSKSRSLAGLRVGFALGHADLISGLERVKNSFNCYPLDRVALAGAQAAIEDVEYFNWSRKEIISIRDELAAELRQLGFEVLPSKTNFVFARHPRKDALLLAQALREKAILVRHFTLPRIDQFMRISIGTRTQIDSLLSALRELI
jgi:histidinol-phosphate aminotransferase